MSEDNYEPEDLSLGEDVTPVTDKRHPKAFWIIFNPHYPAPPKVRFATQDAAEAVAERMALQFGQEFYVMRAVTRYTRPEKAKRKALA